VRTRVARRVGTGKSVLLDEPIEGAAADSESLCGLHLVTRAPTQHVLDVTPLHPVEVVRTSDQNRCTRDRCRLTDLDEILGQVGHDNRAPLGEEQRVADGPPDAGLLLRELADFRVTVTSKANETFGAGSYGGHDDLVLAAALTVWPPGKP
jgi:hypothetical protein